MKPQSLTENQARERVDALVEEYRKDKSRDAIVPFVWINGQLKQRGYKFQVGPEQQERAAAISVRHAERSSISNNTIITARNADGIQLSDLVDSFVDRNQITLNN